MPLPMRPRAPRKTPMAAVNAKPVGPQMAGNIKPRVNPRAAPSPVALQDMGPKTSDMSGGTGRATPGPANYTFGNNNPGQEQTRSLGIYSTSGRTPPTDTGGGVMRAGMGQKSKSVGKGGKATLTQKLAAKAGHKEKNIGKGQKANPFAKMKQESKASEKAEKKAGKDNKREEKMELGKGAKNPFKSKSQSMKRTKPGIAIAIKMGTNKPKGFPSSDKRGTKGMRGGNNKPPFPMGMGQKSKSKKSSKAYY